jgi:hypothetical protein
MQVGVGRYHSVLRSWPLVTEWTNLSTEEVRFLRDVIRVINRAKLKNAELSASILRASKNCAMSRVKTIINPHD